MSRSDRPDRHLSLRLDAELHQRLADQARAEDRSVSSLVRTALRAYLPPAGRPQAGRAGRPG